ncbi:sulfatase-like hydrolase/transferase [Aeoliella sp.]|uniref:sulfatase-like hydrolase/transferase n=1 Tax=Aeoliella sp. TaxID=2795800 RepID=UPI003CCB8297
MNTLLRSLLLERTCAGARFLPIAAMGMIGMLVAWTLYPASAVGAQPPNVVVVLSDDQAWTDYGFMGHEVIQTPHLDQLASRSLVLPRGYVTTSLCRPSLASIVTGLYPHQHGVVANDVDHRRRAVSDLPMRRRFHQHPSLVRMLVDHGYLAFQSGKWWEGSWQDGGFTDGMTHGDPNRRGRHGDEGLKIGRETMTPVLEFMDSAVAENRPFFLWYAPFMPHTPHNPPERLLQKYQTPGRPANVAKYFAMCEWFDESCGTLLDHLRQAGIEDNTMVVYVCDNGWAPVDKNAPNLPDGWWPDYAPRSKGAPYELGIRTPIMVSWPGKVESERSQDLASSIDLMPTILTACGITPPEGLPGIDLRDARTRAERKAVYGGVWSTHNAEVESPMSTLQYRWCVTDPWKLLLRHRGEDTTRYQVLHEWDTARTQLFDLSSDPAEQHNKAGEQADVVQRLSQQIDQEIPK